MDNKYDVTKVGKFFISDCFFTGGINKKPLIYLLSKISIFDFNILGDKVMIYCYSELFECINSKINAKDLNEIPEYDIIFSQSENGVLTVKAERIKNKG